MPSTPSAATLDDLVIISQRLIDASKSRVVCDLSGNTSRRAAFGWLRHNCTEMIAETLAQEDSARLRLVRFLNSRTRTIVGDRAFGEAGPRVWDNLPVDFPSLQTAVSDSRWRHFYLVSRTKHSVNFPLTALYKSSCLLTYLLTYYLLKHYRWR